MMYGRSYGWVIPAVTTFLAAGAAAQTSLDEKSVAVPGPATTLSQAVEKAILTNPEVGALFHDFTSSLEGQNVGKGAWRPQITAQGWAGREWRSNMENTPSYDWSRPGWSLDLRQVVFDGFSTHNSVAELGFEKLSSYYELLSTSNTVAKDAANAYLDVQRYRERERLARENFNVHQSILAQLRERRQSGVGRGVDLEQANGRLSLAQTNLITESNNLNDVLQRYRRLVGEYPASSLDVAPEVDGNLPSKNTVSNFEESLRLNPAILSKQALVQAAEAGEKVAKAAHSPKIEFVASTGRDREEPGESYRDRQSSSVQLLLTYNLYRGGADEARRRQTVAQHYAARDVRDYTCRNVQQDLSVAWNGIERLRNQLPFLREHELSTAKVRQAYRQQFQIGQRSLLDLLDTENELFDASRSRVDAEFDLKQAKYEWLSASAKLLPAIELSQVHVDAIPDENKQLALPADVVNACVTPLPDTNNLAPVAAYGEGDQPPQLKLAGY
jgi:adhesin transport system outer membrane protein